MRLWVPVSLPSVALIFVSVGHAIFADEAYQTDYHIPLLGLPQPHTTFFHRPSPASKASLLYTLSNRLVLGAVNPKDGAVIWRQQLADQAENDTASGLLKAPEGGNTLVSALNGKIQTWDAADGRLVWEWRGQGRIKSIETSSATDDRGKDVVAVSDEDGHAIVRKLAGETGEISWEYTDARSSNSAYPCLSTGRADTTQ